MVIVGRTHCNIFNKTIVEIPEQAYNPIRSLLKAGVQLTQR